MPPLNDNAPVTLDFKTFKRFVNAVRKVEAMTTEGRSGRRSAPFTYGIVRARVTTAIPAGTWTSPSSSGRAQIRHKDGSGTWSDSGDPVTVYNDHTFCPGVTSIAVNKVVKLAWISGQWWLVGADS